MNYYSEKIFLHVLFKNIPIGKPDSLGFCNHVCQDSEQSVRVRFQPKSLNTQAKVFRVLSTEQGQALRFSEKTILGPRACGLFSENLVRSEHDTLLPMC